MKKILLFGMFSAFLLFGGKAYSQGTNLTVIADNGEKFVLEVNGSTQNSTADTRVSAYNLFGPTIKVKVYIEDAQVAPVSKTVFNKPNADFYYVLHRNAKGIYVLDPVSSDYTPSVKGEAAAAKTTTDATPAPKEKEAKTASTETAKPATGKSGCSEPLTTEEFAVFYSQIAARPFEGTKVSALKKLVVDKCFTSAQVTEMLHTLDLESSRLDVAKYAFIHVYDPDNYSAVDEVFLSASSVESLHKYVNSKK